MGAMSPTVATDERPSTLTIAVTITSAAAMAKSLRRDFMMRITSTTVARPTAVVDQSILPMCTTMSATLRALLV
jgi:hypothetical protein